MDNLLPGSLNKIMAVMSLCIAMIFTNTIARGQDMNNDDHARTTINTSNEPISARQPALFNLEEITANLNAAASPVNGLRKKVLLNEPSTTIVLLSFEQGGKMPEHSAPGMATINVVKGAVDFLILGKTHHVTAGQVIVLLPKVRHDLTALEPSTVLVTISKTPRETSD